MKFKYIIVVLVLLSIGLAGTFWLLRGQNTDTSPSHNVGQTTQDSPSTNNNPTPATTEPLSGQVAVSIAEFTYKPSSITVKKGTTITWTNQDSVKHNVVTADQSLGGPNGPLIGQGQSYSFTFATSGTFRYYCTPHPYMKAAVIVVD